MLKRYLSYILAAFAALTVAGCADDLTVAPDGVMLRLEITDVSPGVSTRAVPAELEKPVQEMFHLAIVSAESGRTVYDDAFASSVGPFAPGRFALSVSCGTDELALDAPCYAGTATASIYKGLHNVISIDARVANALMSIAYQADGREELDEVFESYGVTLTLDGKEVSIDGPDATQSAYFPAGSVPQVTFHAVRKDDQRAVSVSLDAALAAKLPLEAGQHAKVTLGVDLDRVQIAKVDIEEVTISQTIPPSWLPKPKTSVSGFDEQNALSLVETDLVENAHYTFSTSSQVQDLEFSIQLADPSFSHVNGSYTLSTLTSSERAALEAIGIRLPNIGDEQGDIDFSALLTNLCCDLSTDVSTSTFSLRVKANDRWDAEDPTVLSVNMRKPQFALNLDPRNVWSKTIYLDETRVDVGTPERVRAKLRYQYSNDGGATWQFFSAGTTQQFRNHPDNRDLQVRAFLRDGLVSDVVNCTLETPAQLPNSDMEEWHYKNVARKMNTYYPYNEGATAFWNTNNPYTTRYVSTFSWFNAGSNPYNCMPAVSYVLPGHTGSRAAEIRSTASGRGNTLPSNVLNLNKVPGELFTADISVKRGGTDAIPSGDNYTVDPLGRSFASRPTALHFWYKYAPLNGDAWRAKIVLLDADNNTIIEKNLETSGASSTWAEQTVSLDYLPDAVYAKCSRIFVVFSSSIHDTRNDEMPWQVYSDGYSLWEGENLVLKNDTRCWLGSILTIDDIELIYDK